MIDSLLVQMAEDVSHLKFLIQILGGAFFLYAIAAVVYMGRRDK